MLKELEKRLRKLEMRKSELRSKQEIKSRGLGPKQRLDLHALGSPKMCKKPPEKLFGRGFQGSPSQELLDTAL